MNKSENRRYEKSKFYQFMESVRDRNTYFVGLEHGDNGND